MAPPTPAELYERYFVSAIFAPWAEDLLRRAAPKARGPLPGAEAML